MPKETTAPKNQIKEVSKDTYLTKDLTHAQLLELCGRQSLGSVIYGLEANQELDVTFTGEIFIKKFTDSDKKTSKNAYYRTKEGINVKVNDKFLTQKIEAESTRKIIVKEMAPEGERTFAIKYAQLVD